MAYLSDNFTVPPAWGACVILRIYLSVNQKNVDRATLSLQSQSEDWRSRRQPGYRNDVACFEDELCIRFTTEVVESPSTR